MFVFMYQIHSLLLSNLIVYSAFSQVRVSVLLYFWLHENKVLKEPVCFLVDITRLGLNNTFS